MTDQTNTHPCTNCGGPVASRRKSKTGTHWCSKLECRSAKQRFYYRHRSGEAERQNAIEQIKRDRLDIVAAALRGPRTECQGCGRADAIFGFQHPTPAWDAPCAELGLRAGEVGMEWMLAIWPNENTPDPTD